MALEAPKTLVYIRSEVMARCTIRADGDRGARAIPIVDSMIRSAHKRLLLKAPWLRLKGTATVALATGVTAYDFPDTMEPGDIAEVWVKRVADNRYAKLDPEPDQYQRNAFAASGNGLPRWYWFDNGNLNIVPAPDITLYSQMRLDGYLAGNDLVNDEDTISIDDEALIQMAEILVRPKIGLVVDEHAVNALGDYISDVAAEQTEGAGFVLGGATSAKLRPEDGSAMGRFINQPYDANWIPPGYWGS